MAIVLLDENNDGTIMREGDVVEFRAAVWLCVSNYEPSLTGLRARVEELAHDHVWFRLLPHAGTEEETQLLEDLNGLGTDGPLFVVDCDSPLVVEDGGDWRMSITNGCDLVAQGIAS